MKTDKYICIHGHFYQPPREHAWLETIEVQKSARPWHDWNERINFECYAPNRAARILDEAQRISKIVNNYERISFNFGPTLLQWLENADPETYHHILEADRKGAERFGGHGPAMAQVYGHLIMPLANARDKLTQVRWGIQDFSHRFGRAPEGMWLAETAVDTPTLEVLAAEGISFTVLAPRQAAAIRALGDGEWEAVDEGNLPTDRAYRCQLPSGAAIDLFFYNGPVSRAVAFEGLLNDGKAFAERLFQGLDTDNPSPQLMHIATDGESYGHHHRFGEMALANCLETIEEQEGYHLTVYGQFLEENPPAFEVQIHELSSWSCEHGVERWRADCGCNTGSGYQQQWRAPLRKALDWLREELASLTETVCADVLTDPWAARDAYIHVVLDRSVESKDRFMESLGITHLSDDRKSELLRVMEMQRQTMQMYTSCGWFFDEISGIETLQILQYAVRAINLASELGGRDLLPEFLAHLEGAPSNVMTNGAQVLTQEVLPSQVDLERVGMHLSAAALFEEYPDEIDLFVFRARALTIQRLSMGNFRLAVGQMAMQNTMTLASNNFYFAVLHLGQHHLLGHISESLRDSEDASGLHRITEAFQMTDIERTIYLMEHIVCGDRFSFEHLFADEKFRILKMLSYDAIQRAEDSLAHMFRENEPLMDVMERDNLPVPRVFRDAVTVVLNRSLVSELKKAVWAPDAIEYVTREMVRWDVPVSDAQAFQLLVGSSLCIQLTRLSEDRYLDDEVSLLVKCLDCILNLKVKIDLWRAQNLLMTHFREGLIHLKSAKQMPASLSLLADQLRVVLQK